MILAAKEARVFGNNVDDFEFNRQSVWTASHWFALYTKSRHEKILSEKLNEKGFETFLPTRKIERHWSDRKKIIEEPLFKSYLFIYAPLQYRTQILQTAGAVCFVEARPSEPVPIAEKDILRIHQFIKQEVQLDPFPYLKKGDRVFIRSGPLKGTEGFIVRKNRHCRLVISLDTIEQSFSVEVDEACIEPIRK